MTPRLQLLSVHTQHAVEGVVIGATAVWQAIATLTDKDWDRLLGPHGLTVAAIMVVGVLWVSNVLKERREEKNRERRHKEQIDAAQSRHDDLVSLMRESAKRNVELSEENKELTAESIKAHLKGIGAINSMDRSIQNLTIELKDRPCQKIKPVQDDA